MTQIFNLDQIKSALHPPDVIQAVETGFALYSQGKVVVPPVGHLQFDDPPGDVHIKYGYIKGDNYYVIKIASGFYDNPRIGLPASDGSLLVYSQQTGELLAILLDEGYLTDLRTGAAGAVAAKYLAPRNIRRIGIVGTGTQARCQLDLLRHVVDCRSIMVWGRDEDKLAAYGSDMERHGFHVQITLDIRELAATCNLIVTTTPARVPLLMVEDIQPGTHITAVGADNEGKQELDPAIIQKADIVAADSIVQCVSFGELSHAVRSNRLNVARVVELGMLVDGRAPGRASDEQLTIADLTGVAIQDIQIAKMAYLALRES